MYCNVKLLNGFQQTLTYKIPDSWQPANVAGSIVTVPLQKRTELALVMEIFEQLPKGTNFKIRDLTAQEKIPADKHYAAFITKLSAYYMLEPMIFYKRLKQFLSQKEVEESLFQQQSPEKKSSLPPLTEEQQVCCDQILPAINTQTYKATLLHGVTGSGKTEIYKQTIMTAFQNKKAVLFLVPEVSLAVQFTSILKASLPTVSFFGFHSATSIHEKKELWHALMHEHPVVIIGVHLPLLLPIANLGLIIIDEEHDVGFQEKKHPKINSKEAALMRAHLGNIPIILGSATPSIQSLSNVEQKKWALATLKNRFAGAFPLVKTVKISGMDTKETKRSNFWISRELEDAIRDRLKKNEQIIIFLNRRGYSFFVQCSDCGFVFECPSCSVSLTLHEDGSLRCHYCNHLQAQPDRCPQCKPQKPTLLKKGIGTQQVVTILEKLFPGIAIARADLDSTINKKKWQETITKFQKKEISLLVGTQTITKGYHFPGVTLVGILWADINLHMPFYNASETTLQQLIQVAGRAGRQSPESLVIVQSMIEHPIFEYLDEQQYAKFYKYAIEHRRELGYPPCMRFAEIELKCDNEATIIKESKRCAQILYAFAAHSNNPLTILGPASPPVHKIKNVFSRKLYLKSQSYTTIHAAYQELLNHEFQSHLFFTPNPLQ